MEAITTKIRNIAGEALLKGEVDKILGFEKGEFIQESCPVFISDKDAVDSLVWDAFCVNNLSKYLIDVLKTTDKVGVFLKGCDSLGFNQLLQDNRIDAEKVVIYGVPCAGMINVDKLKKEGLHKGLSEVKRSGDNIILLTNEGEKQVLARQYEYDKCLTCKYPNPIAYQELVGEEVKREIDPEERFREVEEIENMSTEGRYDYWLQHFSKCIRCYACRNICPACSCEKCIFENNEAGLSGKAKVDSEDQFFHITRAYHVAGRCVDCGECSRACPEGIPLHQLNRKIIKDINDLYGEYDAGLDPSKDATLITYDLEDVDPFEKRKGGK